MTNLHKFVTHIKKRSLMAKYGLYIIIIICQLAGHPQSFFIITLENSEWTGDKAIHTHMHARTHTYTHIHTHTRARAYAHTCTHTHTRTKRSRPDHPS